VPLPADAEWCGGKGEVEGRGSVWGNKPKWRFFIDHTVNIISSISPPHSAAQRDALIASNAMVA